MTHHEEHESLVTETSDRLVSGLNKVILYVVRALAILMVLVIIISLVDVANELFQYLTHPPYMLIHIENLIPVLGSFLGVLIALEVYLNIIFYLKRDAIHVPLVLATALTAVARKVIVLDYTKVASSFFLGIAGIVFAVGIVYWLITKKSDSNN